MNEITKLYENADVKKDWNPTPYGGVEEYYPPFTAEKKIELIKWIAKNKEECRITYDEEYKWCTQTDWQSSFCYDNFSESLANLINSLWQDLTEEDKQQIKEILK